MLFSAHVADNGVLATLRRRTPQAGDVSGLKSAVTMTGAPFTASWLPSVQPGRGAMVACWEDAESIEKFLADHPTGQQLSTGVNVTMELFRAVGVWPGLDDDMAALAATVPKPDGPTVAITIGKAYASKLLPFAKVSHALDVQFLESPNTIWGTALTNPVTRMVASLTFWPGADAAEDYMRNGAHAAAVKDHFDFAKDPTGHTFVTGGGFFGFRPLSITGSLEGKNPFPADSMVLQG